MPKDENRKKLTDRQERFCREYIIYYNATDAAIRAGYSKKTAYSIGSENLKKPELLARVRELQTEQAERLCINADWVVMQLVEVYNRCMQHKPVYEWYNGKLEETGEYAFDSKGALNALEMIGKHLAMFSGKTPQDSKQDVSKLFEVLSGGKSK